MLPEEVWRRSRGIENGGKYKTSSISQPHQQEHVCRPEHEPVKCDGNSSSNTCLGTGKEPHVLEGKLAMVVEEANSSTGR